MIGKDFPKLSTKTAVLFLSFIRVLYQHSNIPFKRIPPSQGEIVGTEGVGQQLDESGDPQQRGNWRTGSTIVAVLARDRGSDAETLQYGQIVV